MKLIAKRTKMLDGQIVFDLNIPTNSHDRKKLIITCETKQSAIDFVTDFEKLLEKHTIERLESCELTNLN